jgi:Arc/MetJ-type ribon-helix-helix transcriptional regulator
MYSASDPWFAVCRAHYDGVLTDEDFVNASDRVRAGMRLFAEQDREKQAISAELHKE